MLLNGPRQQFLETSSRKCLRTCVVAFMFYVHAGIACLKHKIRFIFWILICDPSYMFSHLDFIESNLELHLLATTTRFKFILAVLSGDS